jgi:hypothetical protein
MIHRSNIGANFKPVEVTAGGLIPQYEAGFANAFSDFIKMGIITRQTCIPAG